MIDYIDVYSESDGKIALAAGDIELLLNFEEAMALHIELGNTLQDTRRTYHCKPNWS